MFLISLLLSLLAIGWLVIFMCHPPTTPGKLLFGVFVSICVCGPKQLNGCFCRKQKLKHVSEILFPRHSPQETTTNIITLLHYTKNTIKVDMSWVGFLGFHKKVNCLFLGLESLAKIKYVWVLVFYSPLCTENLKCNMCREQTNK